MLIEEVGKHYDNCELNWRALRMQCYNCYKTMNYRIMHLTKAIHISKSIFPIDLKFGMLSQTHTLRTRDGDLRPIHRKIDFYTKKSILN